MPYMTQASTALTDAVNANKDNLQGISSGLGGAFGGALDTYMNGPGQAAINSGLQGAQDVIGGKYLNGNPYLDGIIAQTSSAVRDGVNSNFGAAGRTGGSGHAYELAKGLAEAENGLRYQNYADERGRQMQAMGLLPGLNEAQYGGLNTIGGLGELAATLPLSNAQTLASGLGGLWGGSTTTTQKQGLGSSIAGILGAGLSGWAGGGFKGL